MPSCVRCGAALEIVDKVFRKDECPACGGDLHCCIQCRFYERGRQNDCRESRAENVRDKDKANYCDYYDIGNGDGSLRSDPAQAAKAALDALFRK